MQKIEESKLKSTCLFGRGKLTCSFLAMSSEGFVCLKAQPSMRANIEARRAACSMNAMGDNCHGAPDYLPIIEGAIQ